MIRPFVQVKYPKSPISCLLTCKTQQLTLSRDRWRPSFIRSGERFEFWEQPCQTVVGAEAISEDSLCQQPKGWKTQRSSAEEQKYFLMTPPLS